VSGDFVRLSADTDNPSIGGKKGTIKMKAGDHQGTDMVLRLGISRRLLLAAAGASMARPSWAELRPGSFRVGFLFGGTRPDIWLAAFLGKLTELGYAEGKNVAIEIRAANGAFDHLPGLARELIDLHCNVIVATTTPSIMALFKVHCSLPVVFIIDVDPIKLGAAESIPHPGGNYTGLVNTANELSGKRLQILRDLLPNASRVASFINPANDPGSLISILEKTAAEATRLGFRFTTIEVASGDEFFQAFAKAADQKADALLLFPDPLIFSNRLKIIALAREQNSRRSIISASRQPMAGSSPTAPTWRRSTAVWRFTSTRSFVAKSPAICRSSRRPNWRW
jgi:putative tryptophan/tyrosine transport system substrate-binding protein